MPKGQRGACILGRVRPCSGAFDRPTRLPTEKTSRAEDSPEMVPTKETHLFGGRPSFMAAPRSISLMVSIPSSAVTCTSNSLHRPVRSSSDLSMGLSGTRRHERSSGSPVNYQCQAGRAAQPRGPRRAWGTRVGRTELPYLSMHDTTPHGTLALRSACNHCRAPGTSRSSAGVRSSSSLYKCASFME